MTKQVSKKGCILFLSAIWFTAQTFYAMADSTPAHEFVIIKTGIEDAEYATELFNLLRNQKDIVDNKNYYKKDFESQFNALLMQAKATHTRADTNAMKKRLLSGPAAKGRVVNDRASQKKYFYFDACQAHDCGETNLGLLFEPRSRRMLAKLTIRGTVEFLGAYSDTERALLNYMQIERAR
jgi:hypothetical protein